MRINYKDKLTLADSYELYKDTIQGEFNRASAKYMYELFGSLKNFLTENRGPDFRSDYAENSQDKVASWRMLLESKLPFQNQDAMGIYFGDNDIDHDDYRDEYFNDDGVLIYHVSFNTKACILSYELFVSYVVLVRNSYEQQLIAEGKDKEEVSNIIGPIDQLIYEYCDRYKIEIAEDFTVFYSNFKHHILRLVVPGREYENIEIPEPVEIMIYRQGIEETLPLGSVVTLKMKDGGATNYGLVIVDRFIISQDNPHLYYSYKGVLYPIGTNGESKAVLFDHDQIDTVLHKGYEDKNDKKYVLKILNSFYFKGIERIGTRLHKPMVPQDEEQ